MKNLLVALSLILTGWSAQAAQTTVLGMSAKIAQGKTRGYTIEASHCPRSPYYQFQLRSLNTSARHEVRLSGIEVFYVNGEQQYFDVHSFLGRTAMKNTQWYATSGECIEKVVVYARAWSLRGVPPTLPRLRLYAR